MDITKITNFVLKYGNRSEDKKTIRRYLESRIGNNTAMVIKDDKEEIIALSVWDWQGGTTIEVIDLVIHPEHRGKGLIKRMLLKFLQKYPQVRFLVFEREAKYPGSGLRIYSIKNFLGRR